MTIHTFRGLVLISTLALGRWVTAGEAPDQPAKPDTPDRFATVFRVLTGPTTPELPAQLAQLTSFVYGSRKSSELLPGWTCRRQEAGQATQGAKRPVLTSLADPKTGLQVEIEACEFADFHAVEWVVRFQNTGTADTPILQEVWPLDLQWSMGTRHGPAVLYYAKGAICSIDDFAPMERALEPGTVVQLEPGGGRSSSEWLPFFNVDLGGQGIVLAIGWTGQWKATFRREQDRIHVQAGMASTHLKLRPGEAIRTPRILLLAWQGRRLDGNNLLRRCLLAHHRPQPGGKPLVLPVLVGSWGGTPAAEHLKAIERIAKWNLPIELYWIDAEWFGKAPWFSSPGNWELRKELYPQGFKALSEPLHRSGRRLLLWFEPQRVCRGTPWAQFKDRPGWLLELKNGTPEYQQRNCNWGIPHEDPRWVIWESRRTQINEGDMLYNLGEPGARRFLTDWLSDRIREFGLDWYREDFNIAPLEYWQANDAPDRRGMTEIRYVEGLYTMWDELLRRHPHLAIDNCASGGRRIDLETIGRATALWRTDWPVDALHRQCHTYGLMCWVPLHMSDGAVLEKGNEYEIRSAMTAGLNVKLPAKDDEATMRQAKAMIEQYLQIQRFFYGDYYPLTPYSQKNDTWMAYQLHLPERDEGLVVVLRRPASPQESQFLRLFGLKPEARYELVDLDSGTTQVRRGEDLMAMGFEIRLPTKPGSALVRCRRWNGEKPSAVLSKSGNESAPR